MAVVHSAPRYKTAARLERLTVDITAGGDTGGALASIANPWGDQAIIVACTAEITTASGGAATADIGVAANGTTLSDTILDGININTTASYNHVDDAGTNGVLDSTFLVWDSGEFITASIASGTDGAVVGTLTVWALVGGL